MHKRSQLALVAVLAFLVGLVGGGFLGFEWSSRIWLRMSIPLMTSTGNQAHVVLTLLDQKKDAQLRETMEGQIDDTLETLRTLNERKLLPTGTPTSQLFRRLQAYRTAHPRQQQQGSESGN